jgi:ethanolamine ammonia-lyase large subunit
MNPPDLRRTLALANAFKEGDLLVGGTRDDRLRDEARQTLLGTRCGEIRQAALVEDGITEALNRSIDRRLSAGIDPLTIAQLTGRLLAVDAPEWIRHHRDGLASEVIASAAKVMTDEELSSVARMLFNPLPGDGVAIGSPRHFGSRIQPNSPGDDEQEILFSVLEGLSQGCGDVIIGLNPASDDLDTIVQLEELLGRIVDRLDLPTRYCVLSDIVKQHRARERVVVDVGFQSLAGTSKALSGMVGLDVDGLLDVARDFDALYFETGQGSAVTNGAAEGVDMVTLEARAYGVARHIKRETGAWMIVNDVAGFIGPEVFARVEQLERACLEDAVMAKLHGLTMGLDVCATFHMGIAPPALRDLTSRVVARAAPAYLMAVAGNADPMLGYLTTSFRDHPRLRRQTGRTITSGMDRRLRALGSTSPSHLYAAYAKAGGDERTFAALIEEGGRTLETLRRRGFDLGCASTPDGAMPPEAEARLEAIYAHARRALYAQLERAVVEDASMRHLWVRSAAADRDDYLSHPPSGEALRPSDARAVATLYSDRRPQVQIVVSDGLNANAVNEQARVLLPAIRRGLAQVPCDVGETDLIVQNGRVRAGYHVGELLDAAAIVHLIGERPGTGLNTLSAYLTYGRDVAGRSRWSRALDHSCTTAICGIHPGGTPPDTAAAAVVRTVAQMIDKRCSGIALTPAAVAGRPAR